MIKHFSIFKVTILTLLAIIFLTGALKSQEAAAIKFKQPLINIELLFSYSQPIPNLFSNVQDLFYYTGYGVKYGFGSQINVKMTTNKKGTMKPYLSLGYNLFLGSDNSNSYISSNTLNSWPPGTGNSFVQGTSKMYIHDFSLGGGYEYDFVNKTRWTPYVGGELDLNFLFGTYRQTPYPNTSYTSFTIKEATRFGFGTEAGITFRIAAPIGITFCTKYKFDNLIGKSSTGTTDLNKMTLLDKSDITVDPNLTKSRNIDYFEFMLGATFYIGKR